MILILTGPVGSGKTTLLKRVVAGLKNHDVRFTGYLSERVLKADETSGYDLLDLNDGRSLPFLRKEGGEYWPRTGVYYFNPEGLQIAWNIIRRTRESELLIIDELGPAELEGGGVWPPLKNVLFIPLLNGLFVVRETIVADFLAILENRPARIFEVGDPAAYGNILDTVLRPA